MNKKNNEEIEKNTREIVKNESFGYVPSIIFLIFIAFVIYFTFSK